MLIAFAVGWLIPYFVGLGSYVLVAWVPFYLLACVLVPNVAKAVVPPKLEDADLVAHRSVLRRNLELFIGLWLYWILFILVNGIISGALEGKRAFFQYLSGPLGWFDPAFIVRPETTSVGTFGIFLANTFICAVFFFPLSVIFRVAFRRSHITQLGLNRSEKTQGGEEDDDDEV